MTTSYRLSLFCLLLMLQSTFAIAQERAGLSLGKNNGVNTTLLNPTTLLANLHKWQANVGGGHIFGHTDYAVVTNSNLIRLSKEYDSVSTAISDRSPSTEDKQVIYNNIGKTYFDLSATALGPGFSYKISEKTVVGISTRGRVLTNAYDITEVVNYPTYTNLSVDTIYTATPFHGNAAAFGEINLHLAQALSDKLAVGITAKYLMGYEALHFRNKTRFDLQAFDEIDVDVLGGGAFDLYHSNPEEDNIKVKGHGIGVDLGATLIAPRGMDGTTVGVSLLDLGFIAYEGSKRSYDWETGLLVDGARYENEIVSLAALDTLLGEDFNIVSETSKFNVVLPLAISLQVEQAITEELSVAAYWVQRLKSNPNQLARSNSLNVTGLYEQKHFSAFLPVTLYNYSELRVGAAVRLGFLTIGSDRLLSLFGSSDFNGSDFYANVQVYPFKLRKNGNGGRGAKGDKNVECFSF